jgi:hypothetical protein
MSIRDRIGIDIGRRLRHEDALEWAAEHEVRWIDIQLDAGANALSSFGDARAAGVRRVCERYGVHLGLHTASAVNVAEVAPYVGDGVERYLEAYVEIAPRLGAEWIAMHAGFHFTSDKERRMAAGLDRLKRIVGHAERHGALVLLENLNKEPDEAEIHYLAHTIEEWRYYFDAPRTLGIRSNRRLGLIVMAVPGSFADMVDEITPPARKPVPGSRGESKSSCRKPSQPVANPRSAGIGQIGGFSAELH